VPATLMEKAEASSVKSMLQRLAAGLKRIGFSAVYDTGFAADLTIMEEVSELAKRVQTGGVLPMFTSCSPAWIQYVESQRPDLIPNLSTCKSPQQMAASLIKDVLPKEVDLKGKRIVCVSLMPCTAKKFEASEVGDVDMVLTTREVEVLFGRFGLDLSRLTEHGTLDAPFSSASSAGRLFGGTGGVMEAAIRTAHKMLTGRELKGGLKVEEARGLEGVKRFTLDVGGTPLNFAVVNGLGRLPGILEPMAKGTSDLHFVEVMSCPGGCIGGGGQPYDTDPEVIRERLDRLYETDRRATLRVSHDNGEVQALYESMLGKPLGEVSHHLLHRTYVDRKAKERQRT
jgi:iron-only hydrogenase group A